MKRNLWIGGRIAAILLAVLLLFNGCEQLLWQPFVAPVESAGPGSYGSDGYGEEAPEIIPVPVRLSTELALADFEQMFQTVVKSYPNLTEMKKLYGFSFDERKAFYEAEIRKASSNFEYFCVFSAILNDYPSCHSWVYFPQVDMLGDIGGYYEESLTTDMTMLGKNLFLYDDFWEEMSGYYDASFALLDYVDGAYLLYPLWEENDLEGSVVLSVNGMTFAKWAERTLLGDKIKYDFENRTAFRTAIVLNSDFGEPLEIEFETPDGERVIDNTWRYSLYAESALNNYYFESDDYEYEPADYVNFSHVTDDVRSIEYVRIDDMENEANAGLLKKTLEKLNPEYAIIIDLRYNSGGYQYYAADYIYSAIYSRLIKQKFEWFIPDTADNGVINYNRSNITRKESKDGTGYNYSASLTYDGKSRNKSPVVYYLIGEDTASAADTFASFIKANKLGVLVGSNTMGEGLADSYIAYPLDNSGLVFTYYPASCVNDEGKNNSIYGTAPNVYARLSVEGYRREMELIAEDRDLNDYYARLDWDTVLKRVVEMIGNS